MSDHPLFVPIVEGHGEVRAVPVLIRRIFAEYHPEITPEINPPARIKSGAFLNDPAYFNRYIALAAAKAAQAPPGSGKVLILLDCEDDCPAVLGPRILEMAAAVRDDVSYLVALARREFETWFLASAESLAGISGLPGDHSAPPTPESIRGAKEWLGRHMRQPYDPIIHQTPFTARFDVLQARTVPSFDRLVSKLLP